MDTAEFTALRNQMVRLHNLAGMETFGDFNSFKDTYGSHFVRDARGLGGVSAYELDINLGSGGDAPIEITHHYMRPYEDCSVKHSLEYKLPPSTRLITVSAFTTDFNDGITGKRPIGERIPLYADIPLDDAGIEEFKRIIDVVASQQGLLLPVRRFSRIAAMLLNRK